MPKMTQLFRVSDSLPLSASMEDEKDHRELDGLKSQAKKIVKQLSGAAPASKVSIDSGSSCFHYINERGVCYLCLTDKSYPKRLAFNYLEELQKECVRRPCCISTRRLYTWNSHSDPFFLFFPFFIADS